MMMVVRPISFLFLLSAVVCAGCGTGRDVSKEDLEKMSGAPLVETVSVTGTVSINGEPAAGVNIYAYSAKSGRKAAAQCRTGADGKYCWTKYTSCDGLEPGTYQLAFAHIPKEPKKGDDEGEDLFEGKYRNPTKNDFTLNVASGEPQTEVDYNLE